MGAFELLLIVCVSCWGVGSLGNSFGGVLERFFLDLRNLFKERECL